jgi:SAM-dependent methyltransferase
MTIQMRTRARHRISRPYASLAKAYDDTIGRPAFHRARRAFELLARRYGLRFRSAADIGCGTGLFARYLSECWSAPVWAVDISPEMLRVAERNCMGANVRLLRQDIRCLRLPEPVDLVTSNFDALNHLTGEGDLRVAFQRIADNLRPGGHLYFDLVTPCQPLGGGMTYVRRMNTANRQVIQQFRLDMARRTISAFVIMRSIDSPQPTVEIHSERVYSFAEVGRWLMDAGFVIRGVHDAETLLPASRCPARIIVVAQTAGPPGVSR